MTFDAMLSINININPKLTLKEGKSVRQICKVGVYFKMTTCPT